MFLKTRIKNLQKFARHIRWTSFEGTHFEPGQEKILEGAFPTACPDAATKKQFLAELTAGLVEVTLLTDLPVETPNTVQAPATFAIRTVEPSPEVAKKNEEELKREIAKKLEPVLLPENRLEEKRFVKGPLESFRTEEKRFEGKEAEDAKIPEERPIFVDAEEKKAARKSPAKRKGAMAGLSDAEKFAKLHGLKMTKPEDKV